MRLKTLEPVPLATWLTALVMLVLVIVGIAFLAHRIGKSQVGIPQQSQASAMVVPTATYKYQSVIVFMSCHLLTGVIFVDYQGILHPVDPTYVAKLTVQQALALVSQAPATHTLGVMQASCPRNGVTL